MKRFLYAAAAVICGLALYTRLSRGNADGNSAFSFTNLGMAALYERVRVAVKSGGTASFADRCLLRQWISVSNTPGLIDANTYQQARLLLKAIDRIDTIKTEIGRLATQITSPSRPNQVGAASVAQLDLDYQMAVLTVSQRTDAGSLLGDLERAYRGKAQAQELPGWRIRIDRLAGWRQWAHRTAPTVEESCMTLQAKCWRLLVASLTLSFLLGACASASRAAQPTKRQVIAMAMFQERCKRAGEKIYKSVDNVEGIYLLKLRPSSINYGDQFKLDDPYGRDLGGDGYIQSFLRGSFWAGSKDMPKGGPPRLGYLYVEAEDPKGGKRYRYTGRLEEPWQTNKSYLQGHTRFVLEKTVSVGVSPLYGVTYDDISTREEREYWIAGSSLKVVDMQTNEVIAERVGYMVDWAQGSKAGGRSPWLFAADNACPNFLRNFKVLHGSSGPAFPSQMYQTLDFVEKVLKPASQITGAK